MNFQREYSEQELVRIAAGLPVLFRPGDRWSYSNTGYLLLGAIIHRVTGVFYGDLLRGEIFRPLGMRTARIISESDIVPNRAAGYELVNDSLRNQEWVAPSLNTTADGSLYLTVHDLARWVIGWDAGRVLSAQDRQAAWTPVRLNDGGTFPYGFGWDLSELRAERRIGHTGAWQGFRTSIQRFPGYDLTVIVLANLAEAHPEAMSLAIAGLLEPKLVPPHRLPAPLAGPQPPTPIEDLLGRLADGRDSALVTPRPAPLPRPDGTARLAGGHRRSVAVDGARLRAAGGSPDQPPWCGGRVAVLCARRRVPRGRTAVTALYTGDWRALDVESYRY